MIWTTLIVLLVIAAFGCGTAWLLRNPPTYAVWCLPVALVGLWVLSGVVMGASCITHTGQTGRCEPARYLPEDLGFVSMLFVVFGWALILVSVIFAIQQTLKLRRSSRSESVKR